MNMGDALLKLLDASGINQHELARRAGCTQPYINQICKNKRIPTFDLLERICSAFLISVPVFVAMCYGEKLISTVFTPEEEAFILAMRKVSADDRRMLQKILSLMPEEALGNTTSSVSKNGNCESA